MKSDTLLIFPTSLGWMAVLMTGRAVRRLTFGHHTAEAAESAARSWGMGCTTARGTASKNLDSIVRRLKDYAEGEPVDFKNIEIDFGPATDFQRRVLEQCRRIPHGVTRSYAQLAAKAGYPGAARAVGNCMAGNPIPLIVPCHRVVCSDGRIGAYSAPGGSDTKRRLLALESPPKQQGRSIVHNVTGKVGVWHLHSGSC